MKMKPKHPVICRRGDSLQELACARFLFPAQVAVRTGRD